ncbi:hypothetical protein Bhyg_11323 [Pseudolycoriella hygida]|uniref:Uncharacterized protein n=1 Tax=Pseudolycoriella hygida TaxID=35572 RepID=A0A9Q0MVC8_9DIPT|nr:hypothetical protein Bhyg_11323 [Pseudolycoriella hygida]
MFDPSHNESCASERFYVNINGQVHYPTSEVFCGIKTFTRTSAGNQLALAYVSVRYSGKFSCKVTATLI